MYKNLNSLCVIPGFRREVRENCALLACYAASGDRGFNMGLTGRPEPPGSNYHYSLRNRPEQRSSLE
jgi:hypothetical protein